jgi:hypothetical protein
MEKYFELLDNLTWEPQGELVLLSLVQELGRVWRNKHPGEELPPAVALALETAKRHYDRAQITEAVANGSDPRAAMEQALMLVRCWQDVHPGKPLHPALVRVMNWIIEMRERLSEMEEAGR